MIPLKRLAIIRYGIAEPPAYREEGVPLIRATNIHAGRVLPEGILKIDPADVPNGRALLVTDRFDQLSREAEAAVTLLQERRAALISTAVTGKIDVRGLVPFALEALRA
jgi:hypothetical protein